jgi:uncharacterized protein CbrC (UPF0167 family)
MMDFTYFENPLKFSPLKEGLTLCDTCAQEKICFDTELFYGEDSVTAICPECLAGGKLMDRDIFTCQGDIEELQRQLKDLHPTWSNKDLEDDAAKKTSVLEKTTPHLVTWQDWEWPCADGDYCKFIGYGSKALYASLAPDTDGEQLFKNSFYDSMEEEEDIESFWENILPEEEINDYEESADFDTLFYVFKSLHSDTIVTVWDAS